MDWMYNFNFTTDKVMRPSWILAHPPPDLNGHIPSSGGEKKEGVVPPCLFNVQGEFRAVTYSPDSTFFRVCSDVNLSSALTITAEMRASRGQLREDTVVRALLVWHRNLDYGLSCSQKWCHSLLNYLNLVVNTTIKVWFNLGHNLPTVSFYSELGA